MNILPTFTADRLIPTLTQWARDVALLFGVGGSSHVGYTPSGTGAVATTVQAKLRTLISSDDYDTATNSRAAALAGSLGGFWEDATPKGRVWRVSDRVFVGDAATEGGSKQVPGSEKSWVGNSANGNFTYFDSRSQMAVYNSIGGVGGAFASRSSDNTRSGELNTMAVGGFALNDNTNAADKKTAWALYGHAAQTEANKFTTALELDACSTQTLVAANPYSMGAVGTTAASWIGVGGETAQGLVDAGSGASLTNVSAAIGIVNTASSAAGNRFAKGIVFAANALDGADGTTGTATAMQMALGHEIEWVYSSGANAKGGKIRSTNGVASMQVRQDFSASGLKFLGVNADLTTEVNAFWIVPVASAANYLAAYPAVAGAPPSIKSQGSDTDIDLLLSPKGAGYVRFGTWTSNADAAVNGYVTIKDAGGTTRKLATIA